MLQSFVKYEWTVENEIGMETNIWEDTTTLRAFEVLNKYECNNSVWKEGTREWNKTYIFIRKELFWIL